jgi:uncharacterized protein YbgA (DUF1722 family)/uncharacterized protein YbbK (DUF523 family)
MTEKISVGISSCLLGENVRYDGGHKLDHYLRDTLGRFVEWVPVCPEVECGLSVPREAMRLVGNPESPRLVGIRSGTDHTDRMAKWAKGKVKALEKEDLCGFIFKSRSPSSGMERVKIYGRSGMPSKTGVGAFARVFMGHFPLMPVEEDGRLHDTRLRENFIEKLFIYQRWKNFLKDDGSLKGLVQFHSDHKLLIMAHSPSHLRVLGRLVADGKRKGRKALFREYTGTLMDGLRLQATVKKNVNVLQHMMGYFKKQLSSDEKQELLQVIGNYHRELIPLIVPVVLFQHYVRKYDQPYLKRQYYLNPHALELMLRNHV